MHEYIGWSWRENKGKTYLSEQPKPIINILVGK